MARRGNVAASIAEHQEISSPPIGQLDLLVPTFGACDGYGNSAEQMALAIEKLGITVAIVGAVVQAAYPNAAHIRARERQRDGDAIVFYSQPTAWAPQRTRVGYGFSMYEADTLPQAWLPRLGNVAEIWVPSSWNAEIFDRSQLGYSNSFYAKRPVHVIPLGVNAESFPYKRRERGEKLRFLHFSTVGKEVRKGADLAIQAFQAAFPLRRDVELVLRSTVPSMAYEFVGDTRISVEVGALSTADLAAYYHTFDCLLYPSRGEGFGLIPLEAMASGMPAIFPDATGMHDYADLGLTVETRPVAATVGFGRADRSANAPFGIWQEANIAELVGRLGQVDTEYQSVTRKAESDAIRIANEWTWERSAAAIVARLRA